MSSLIKAVKKIILLVKDACRPKQFNDKSMIYKLYNVLTTYIPTLKMFESRSVRIVTFIILLFFSINFIFPYYVLRTVEFLLTLFK
jgi:hypothetical protein